MKTYFILWKVPINLCLTNISYGIDFTWEMHLTSPLMDRYQQYLHDLKSQEINGKHEYSYCYFGSWTERGQNMCYMHCLTHFFGWTSIVAIQDFASSLKYGELQLLFKTKLGLLFYVNKKLQKPPCCHLVNIQIVQICVF